MRKILLGLLALIAIVVLLAAVLVAAVGPLVAYLVWGWKIAIGSLCLSWALAFLLSLIGLATPKKK